MFANDVGLTSTPRAPGRVSNRHVRCGADPGGAADKSAMCPYCGRAGAAFTTSRSSRARSSRARQREFHAGRDHRGPAGVDGLDDLLGIDALQVDRGHAEVAVPELALNDVQRYALAQEFQRVRVTQLVRREATAHPGPGRATAQRGACRRGVPCPAARAAVDHAEQRADRHLLARLEPWLELLEAPVVHADLTAAATFAAPHERGAAAPVQAGVGQLERLLEAQPGAPQRDDQPAGARAVYAVATIAHDRDDLLGSRRIGRVAAALTAWWTSGEVARHSGRRAAATERIPRR